MKDIDLLTMWSNDPSVSVVIWFVLLVFAMYLGRSSAHSVISTSFRLVRTAMRLTAFSLSKFEQRVSKRNKEVILNSGREASERAIEREFQRINSIVSKDLSGYPAVQRQISDVATKLEKDYQKSSESPPSPPAWIEAVEAVSRIPRNGDQVIDQILDNIKESIEKSHEETIDEYRKNGQKRNSILKSMLPDWRSVTGGMTEIKSAISDLKERASFIDQQMGIYEDIRREDDGVTRMLASSSMTQFFISGLVLLIAILGGLINFQLIALPMSEMVGGTSQLGDFRTADIAAMVIIMVELAMGLFLLESLRITHLFPLIGSMDDKMRKRMMFITLLILTILATVEASLAYMRDLLALDREALSQTLSGVQATNAEFRWIPSIGQMTMGFILPFALAFVAIPLESFIHANRTVLGLMIGVVARVFIYCIRLVGHFAQQVSKVVINVYDAIIFLPLGIEQLVKAKMTIKDDELDDVNVPLYTTGVDDAEKGVK